MQKGKKPKKNKKGIIKYVTPVGHWSLALSGNPGSNAKHTPQSYPTEDLRELGYLHL